MHAFVYMYDFTGSKRDCAGGLRKGQILIALLRISQYSAASISHMLYV
jgi:hypothetical protein